MRQADKNINYFYDAYVKVLNYFNTPWIIRIFKKFPIDSLQIMCCEYDALHREHHEYLQNCAQAFSVNHVSIKKYQKQDQQLAALKQECMQVLALIKKFGDSCDWAEAADTAYTYTWSDLQGLDKLIQEIK